MSVYVIGHKNPDTDAICSAIAYADFLRRTTYPEAEAACCGEVNVRTQFALEQAGLEQPRLLMDVRPTLGSISKREVITARPDETLIEVYRRMQKHRIRGIPVVTGGRRFLGIITFAQLMELVLPDTGRQDDYRRVSSSLERIRRVLGGTFEHAVDADRDEDLTVMVAAMSAEGFTKRMHDFPASGLVIVAGDRPTVQLPALEYGVRCLVLTGGYHLSPALVETARAKGVTVLTSPVDTATTTLLIRSAKLITPSIQTDCLKFAASDLVSDIRRRVQGVDQVLFPIVDEHGDLEAVFSKTDLISPPPVKLILVDHNELTQAVTGADEARILEVVDHHRIGGGLTSREPMRFVNEPVGSTCTIVTKFFNHRDWEPSKAVATCLIAGIVSDTLNLTSPTTTDSDRAMLTWLARVSGIDVAAFARSFFAAGSALETSTPAEAVRMDCKEYKEGPWRFTVAQIEEVGLDRFWRHKSEIEAALDAFVRERGVDFACLMITDITSHYSLLMMAGDPRVAGAVDYPKQEDRLFAMDGIVSRKKQLLPHLARMVGKIEK